MAGKYKKKDHCSDIKKGTLCNKNTNNGERREPYTKVGASISSWTVIVSTDQEFMIPLYPHQEDTHFSLSG